MITLELTEQGALISVSGRLDAQEANQLRARLEEAQKGGTTTFYLTMSEVDFMDSAGLSSVISGLKAARVAGGELYLIAPSESVKKVLEYTLLDRIVPIYSSLQEAQAH